MLRDIVVSIINYRTADLTIGCANSVLEQIGDVGAKIFIVKSCSDDGSVDPGLFIEIEGNGWRARESSVESSC